MPGIEFSTGYLRKELHILALFVPEAAYPAINGLVAQYARRKEESNLALIAALCRAGYVLDYDAIKSATPDGRVNRAHIAAALTGAGYTPTIDHAFGSLLHPGGPFYQPPARPDVFAVLSFIQEIGALSVLAHPFLNLNAAALRAFLDRAVPAGLRGMETRYSLYTPETEALATKIAVEYGLLPSGGSDYHGSNKPDIALGTGKGNLRGPLAFLENLRAGL